MEREVKLTPEDRRTLLTELRVAIFFAMAVCVAGGAGSLAYVFGDEYLEYDRDTLFIIAVSTLLASFGLFYLVGRKTLKDLAHGTKYVRREKVTRKDGVLDNDSANWGLFSHGRGMVKYYIVIGNNRYAVSKEVFQQLYSGSTVEMHFGRYSGTLLGIYPVK